MAENSKNFYDSDYYRSHCGDEYDRGNGWEEIFGNYANRIVKEINPKKTLDVGCAKGFFVEALRDRGVEAYGIDISDYAISEVREDIKPFCKVKSALLPIEEKYDLITCIEVLEHLEGKDISLAIQRMCEATDDIIFSSTPFDYNEESHISIHNPSYWVEQFAYNGFYRDVQYDCSYIAVQTMRFRKGNKDKIELIREYEEELFGKTQEVVAVRHNYQMSVEETQIYKEAYQKHVDIINEELNPQILKLQEEISVLKDETRNPRILKLNDEINRLRDEKKNIEFETKKHLDEVYRKQLNEEIQKRKMAEEKCYEKKKLLKNLNTEKESIERQEKIYGGMALRQYISLSINRKRANKRFLKREREFWTPVFDAEFYAKNNKDVSDKVGTSDKALLKHFIKCGMNEGRNGNSIFDVYKYCAYNPDVEQICRFDKREAYVHYLEHGIKEGRRCN